MRLIQEKEYVLLPSKSRRSKVLLKPLASPNCIQLMLQLRNQGEQESRYHCLWIKTSTLECWQRLMLFLIIPGGTQECFIPFLLSLFMLVVPQFKRASRPPGGLVKVRLLFSFPSKGFQRGQSQRGLKNLCSQQISRGTLRLLSPGGWHVEEPCWRSHPTDSLDCIVF